MFWKTFRADKKCLQVALKVVLWDVNMIKTRTLSCLYVIIMSCTSFQSESKFYSLPECQGTPCSKQAAHLSSNVNEVIRAVLNSLFFLRKDFARTKSTKSTKTQPSKSTKRYKRTKIKNTLKKYLRGKKSLIRLFAFLCFLCEGKKMEKRKKSPQCKCTKYRCPTPRFM